MNQKGQAAVFVLVMIGLILVSTVFLYQSGRITSEKMELQNAADAAAYSASTLEARALNFIAYTNRGMIGNEVGVGQLIGILSWGEELKSSKEYSEIYAGIFNGLADTVEGLIDILTPFSLGAAQALQPLVVALQAIADFYTAVGDGLSAVGKVVVKAKPAIEDFFVPVLTNINWIYSRAQEVYFWGSQYLIAITLFQSIKDNTIFDNIKNNRENLPSILKEIAETMTKAEKDKEGARLSKLGIFALAGHVVTKFIEKTKFTERYTVKDKENNTGMGRMAATVREGRDPFSSGGERVGDNGNRDWHVSAGLDLYFVSFGIGFDSKGGSEILYKDKGENQDKQFVWSAVDTLVQYGEFSYDTHVPKWLQKLGVPNYKGSKIIDAPFGSGSYQATAKTKNGSVALAEKDLLSGVGKDGEPKPKPYGGAWEDTLGRIAAWDVAAVEIDKNKIDKKYYGLQPYRDLAHNGMKNEDRWSFQAPFFLVGVTRSMADIASRQPWYQDFDVFGLVDSEQDNPTKPDNPVIDRIGAIAKSEVYFSRPDIWYFKRADKKLEKPNLFSPFWQPRLVDTSDIDRFVALALQQNMIWVSKGTSGKIPLLDPVLKVIDDILRFLNR